jgi:predicted dehydrogenase
MRSLVIGMGIGQLYKSVLEGMGHEVLTLDTDPTKSTDFKDIRDASLRLNHFNTVHICTPNFTHKEIAEAIAPSSNIIFVEKPGFRNSIEWQDFVKYRPLTHIMMVKNNQWRSNISDMIRLKEQALVIEIRWHNKDRVPNPGTWFTTKELAFGGVSRDLMPHLLSLFMVMEPNYQQAVKMRYFSEQNWILDDVKNTDYGIVNPNGTYDVDDHCRIEYAIDDKIWILDANWRTLKEDDRAIIFTMKDGTTKRIELGLCPEEAYKNMINDTLLSMRENIFWKKQHTQDLWIHETIEKL